MLAEASRLVERNIALPYVALRGMASRSNDVVTRDDLLQAGMMGLVEAARRYDPAQEAAFSTFAMLRIRGAMLDAIRQSDRTRVRWSGRRRAVVMSLERERTESGGTLGDGLEDPVTGRVEEQGCARAMVAGAWRGCLDGGRWARTLLPPGRRSGDRGGLGGGSPWASHFTKGASGACGRRWVSGD